MSLLPKGEVLHKKGERLPVARNRERRRRYASEVAEALREALEAPGMSTKVIMQWTDTGERTVKGWLSASNGPRGDHLIELMRASDIVFAHVLLLSGREVVDQGTLRALRKALMQLSQVIERLNTK